MRASYAKARNCNRQGIALEINLGIARMSNWGLQEAGICWRQWTAARKAKELQYVLCRSFAAFTFMYSIPVHLGCSDVIELQSITMGAGCQAWGVPGYIGRLLIRIRSQKTSSALHRCFWKVLLPFLVFTNSILLCMTAAAVAHAPPIVSGCRQLTLNRPHQHAISEQPVTTEAMFESAFPMTMFKVTIHKTEVRQNKTNHGTWRSCVCACCIPLDRFVYLKGSTVGLYKSV